jgi:hypothetical protein
LAVPLETELATSQAVEQDEKLLLVMQLRLTTNENPKVLSVLLLLLIAE